jgi:D-arabinose 1-dehydrogenase-like Zn-dependent alcohol dehydrogenase
MFPLTISTEPLQLSPLDLISRQITVVGSGSASTASIQAMLEFAGKHNVKPQIEKFPMTESGITDAMQKLRAGKMRYRGVIVAP